MTFSKRTLAKWIGGPAFAAAATFGGLALTTGGAAMAYGPTPGGGSQQQVAPSEPALASTPTGNQGLAFTGADIAITTAAGAAAIGAGGALVLVSRRRRQATAI